MCMWFINNTPVNEYKLWYHRDQKKYIFHIETFEKQGGTQYGSCSDINPNAADG